MACPWALLILQYREVGECFRCVEQALGQGDDGVGLVQVYLDVEFSECDVGVLLCDDGGSTEYAVIDDETETDSSCRSKRVQHVHEFRIVFHGSARLFFEILDLLLTGVFRKWASVDLERDVLDCWEGIQDLLRCVF